MSRGVELYTICQLSTGKYSRKHFSRKKKGEVWRYAWHFWAKKGTGRRNNVGEINAPCISQGACHYLTNRFQMKAPVAPSRSLRGACLREGFAEPPRRLHEPFAEVYEPFAEVAHTEGSTKTPWRVHEASSKGPWMNCMFLLDHDCNQSCLAYIILFLEQ